MTKNGKIGLTVLTVVIAAALLWGYQGLQNQAPEEPEAPGEEIEAPEDGMKERKISYVLYLKYADKPFLSAERFQITLSPDDLRTPMEVALDELMAYEGDGLLVSPIPKGTKLNAVYTQGDLITVDFSKEFMEIKMPKEDARVVIAAVVNTLLFNQETAESVEIKVNGKIISSFNGYEFTSPVGFVKENLFPDK